MAYNSDNLSRPNPPPSGSTRVLIVSVVAVVVIALSLCAHLYLLAENEKDAEWKQGWDYAGANYVLKTSPNKPSAHSIMGSVWMKQGAYTKAVHEYRVTVSLEPANPYNYLYLGNALLQAGQLAQARKEWTAAARLDVPSGGAVTEATRNLRATDGKHP